ncbi:MAG: quinol:electron acceptor oxidoreductase subunit ActD, partial [Candidatus Competibacterales bacterium]|nr:quinol:electron acceptor oxidoreductase subunit ActD [Candidatus Competibacterales bacterium]
MELLGVFRNVEEAAAAVEKLLEAGCEEQDITSVTSVPYPDGVLVNSTRPSRFHWFTLGGGIIGAVAGFLLAAGTAWLYPVQTGDKPIIALFPTGIITSEFMMLCAMLGTIIGMCVELGLPDLERRA